ncbi:MAG: hypothetical protein AAF694_26880 [Bacteroidota bacterium]
MDSLEGYTCDDHLVEPFLKELGWEIQTLSWRKKHPWHEYDKVIVRSTWDYQESPAIFLQILKTIEQTGTTLYNSSSLIQWNLQKWYLRELAQKAIPIVPTLWIDNWQERNFFDELHTHTLVFKPLVSASAHDTFLVHQRDFPQTFSQLEHAFKEREFLVQPFRQAIQSEGEYSLFFFGERYSHCILKRPKKQDFRVQEEHGGKIVAIPSTKELLSLSKEVLHVLPEIPLYARLDYVRNPEGSFEVMEVELIEPSMYLRFDELAPKKFAEAIADCPDFS